LLTTINGFLGKLGELVWVAGDVEVFEVSGATKAEAESEAKAEAEAEAKAEAESEAKAEADVEPDDVSFPGNKLVELLLETLRGLKDKIGCFERTLFFGFILLGLKSSTLSSLIGSKISYFSIPLEILRPEIFSFT
jgi:hypothetical protein